MAERRVSLSLVREAWNRWVRPDYQPEPAWRWTWNPPLQRLADAQLLWPTEYQWPPAAKWLFHLKHALSRLIPVETAPIDQSDCEGVARVVLCPRGRNSQPRAIMIFDYSDYADRINHSALKSSVVYFKFQYHPDHADDPRIVPGGYYPNSPWLYRHLVPLRALRDRQQWRFDVHGRFGLRYRADLRRRAIDLLTHQNRFRYEGGAKLIRHYEFLEELAVSKVAIDLPGNGDLCFRLIDQLALGVTVVRPRSPVRLPEPLVNGVHVVECAEDGSDLVETCARLLEDEPTRQRIGQAAREYHDRFLHRDQLARYVLHHVLERL
ncbi:hypothetical protein Isop_3608 [Isosphaera pallida ATCC 43644]|uniref:Spore protein YkvP/CgeB glycosyl transferase-like domain-containing protein n=1 Tax=Isosphaera pallida (strain ATCC 43644 / DSM 9630 / IS1B) TaxID=575540 RepID=E8QYI2_ISOPI|nr:glycosyltransferase [Isosphaera pallida]ADV64165.1 hypothetical protein Isop_3608 [Isosphaera pallida ATCC 43644]